MTEISIDISPQNFTKGKPTSMAFLTCQGLAAASDTSEAVNYDGNVLATDQQIVGQLPRRLFFIFGNNISHSLSPTIHNTAFAELGLPHHYAILETPRVDENISKLLQSPDFGGASVTFPHKLQIQPLLHSLSDSAKAVGAVNTIVVEENESGRCLRGDNTDWLGILNCIRKCGMEKCYGAATVVGAGGAARAAVFALQHLGYRQITLVNRTETRAKSLTSDFPTLRIDTCTTLSESPPVNVIVACIPAHDLTIADIPQQIFASDGGVVIEMSYKPVVSALMTAASKRRGWKVMGGIDVLKEQAYAQFELWTGRRAPVEAIEAAINLKTTT